MKKFPGLEALFLDVVCGYEEIVRLLLDNGADIEARSKTRGHTALLRIVHSLSNSDQGEEQKINTIRLLIKKGANVRAKSNHTGCTALHSAARNNIPKVADLLLRAGADPLALNQDGKRPLDLALQRGHKEVAERLKKEMRR